jgi:hypothetical protein
LIQIQRDAKTHAQSNSSYRIECVFSQFILLNNCDATDELHMFHERKKEAFLILNSNFSEFVEEKLNNYSRVILARHFPGVITQFAKFFQILLHNLMSAHEQQRYFFYNQIINIISEFQMD